MARKNPEFVAAQVRTWGHPGDLVTQYPYYRSFSGTKTPNFGTYVKTHRRIPDLPYSVDYQSLSISSAETSGQYPAPPPSAISRNWGWFWYRMYPYGLQYFNTDADVKNKAIGRIAKEVGGMKVNLAQAFAERKQTVSLIGSTAMRVASAARALKHGRLGDAAKSLGIRYDAKLERRVTNARMKGRDTLANYWLELQYGWKPLLQDIYGSCDLLAKHIREDSWHHSVRARAKTEQTLEVLWMNDGLWPYENYHAGSTRCTHRAQYSIHYRLDSYARAALATTGISNPALLAWELLPYSFVVDWFIPVGNYLEMLDAFSGFERVSGTYSQNKKAEFGFSMSETRLQFLGVDSYVNRNGIGDGYYGRFQREVLTAFPTPALPTFKNPVSVTHAANAIALLSTAFSREGRRIR
jgi:hypothetical protein